MSRAHRVLVMALLALALVYAVWFAREAAWFALALFALPPLWLALGLPRGGATTAFWAGMLALLWFAHGVMVAWTRPAERGFAWLAVLLALVVVFAASLPGLRARFARKR